MKVNVVIIFYLGLVNDVFVFKDEDKAKKQFKDSTGMDFDEAYQKIVGEGEWSENVLQGYADSNIYEVEVQ